MGKEKNNGNTDTNFRSCGRFCGRIRLYVACAALLVGLSGATCTNTARFIKTDIEKTDGITGMLAYCWRVQKDNTASAGGNTRNCDSIEAEYLRQERVIQCRAAGNKPDFCFNRVYGYLAQ